MAALIEVNTDGLAKFAETICFALGGTARGVRKMADAKAYALELEAITENKVALIKKEGKEALANYIVAKENRKLQNTMAVIEKAQAHFVQGEKVSAEPVDEGWKNRFFGIIEEISDEELREIWGRVLAGEIKRPKSYSLRTLETLRNLTKEEASVVVKAAPYIIGDLCLYKDSILTLQERLLLQEIGLMLDDGIGLEFNWEVKGKGTLSIPLDNNFIFILHNDKEDTVKCNTEVYKLSTAGKEIFKLVNFDMSERESFYKTLANHFYKKGITQIYKHKIVKTKPVITYDLKGEKLV